MIDPSSITLIQCIDIGCIILSFYLFFSILRRTQIQNIMSVVMILIASYSISKMMGLIMFAWVIERFSVLFIVFIMIIFQNEIRRASEKFVVAAYFFPQNQKTPNNRYLLSVFCKVLNFYPRIILAHYWLLNKIQYWMSTPNLELASMPT